MAKVYHSEIFGLRETKYDWLNKHNIKNVKWNKLEPNSEFYLFIPQDKRLQKIYQAFAKITDIFPVKSVGIITARDALTIGWSKDEIWKRVQNFARLESELARQTYQLGKDSRDWKVEFAQKDLKESGLDKSHLTQILYRPFDVRYTYYTGKSRGFHCTPRGDVMNQMLNQNIGLITVRQVAERDFSHTYITENIVECRITLSNKGYGYLFPLFIYPDTSKIDLFSEHETGEKKPNIKPELFDELKKNFKKEVTPEEIFYYIYAVLYSNTYRTKYAEFLKIDFPRVPFTKDYKLFVQLGKLGHKLADLHLLRSKDLDNTISKFPVEGSNKVEKPIYSHSELVSESIKHNNTKMLKPVQHDNGGKVWINKEQYFDGIKEDVWRYQIGGYQVCEKWLKDRKKRTLTLDEIKTYCKIVTALSKTIALQNEIDKYFEEVEKTV